MKVLPFSIPKTERKALIFQEDLGDQFYAQLHQHEEIQFSCVLEGTGSLVVGDRVHAYSQGDIFLIGSNLPHLFASEKTSGKKSHMVTLFFTMESFGKEFFQLPEFTAQQGLMKRLNNGIKVLNKQGIIEAIFRRLQRETELERMSSFLQLLNILTNCRKQDLSNVDAVRKYGEVHGTRMNSVMRYTLEQYQNEITLQEIAASANMTPNAFCKYFKRYTRKTYFEFLAELRIQKACQLLSASADRTVIEIAEEVGFRNISNFNRKFKELMKSTPSVYRKKKRIG